MLGVCYVRPGQEAVGQNVKSVIFSRGDLIRTGMLDWPRLSLGIGRRNEFAARSVGFAHY
jgi:hypothetical protein